MCSGEGTRALPRVGFPIRTSPDQSLISSSPRLIAAVHVLHRLQVPRHPPCALHLLIQIENTTNRYGVFKVRAEERFRRPGKTATAPVGAAGAGLSKLNSSVVGVDVFQASPAIRTALLPSRPGRPRRFGTAAFPRKEVIQPQLPLRLPCYDFTPITDSTFGRCLPRVGARTSGVSGFRGVTGGVYKARERIHRDVADSRLLATPTSWRRVSASNPNWDRLFGIRSTSRFCSPLYRPL
jgi:hypothetical protein